MAIHFGCDPTQLTFDQVEDYLLFLKDTENPSKSYFKHTIYGLRLAFRLQGKEALALRLPKLKRQKDLPVVLSWQETKQMLKTPDLLKHRIMLGLLYGCGLRISELKKLEIKDLDFDRMQLHIRNSKYGKSRYVVLCEMLKRGLQIYLENVNPIKYVFNGLQRNKTKAVPISASAVQSLVKKTSKKCGIKKKVTSHTFRHSYATHLLEMGLDLLSIKEQLGHASIQTTMVYLQVAQLDRSRAFSPLDILYKKK